MGTLVLREGPRSWSLSKDDVGWKTYKIKFLVITDSRYDGPATILTTPGLPQPGQSWNFDNDFDFFAICYPNVQVKPLVTNEPNFWWELSYTFSNKAMPEDRCQDVAIDDPLAEPDRVSGTFVKYTQEVVTDKDNNLIVNSAHQRIRGKIVEFDFNRPTVTIRQNSLSLDLNIISQMVDTVNTVPMWGLPTRCVKLSNFSWERKLYGTCAFYYTRQLDFDICYETFDRVALDEATKVLHGHWEATGWVLDNIDGSPPDPDNPQHFDEYKDRNGENTIAILDGTGKPAQDLASAGGIDIKYYSESDFFALGVPAVF